METAIARLKDLERELKSQMDTLDRNGKTSSPEYARLLEQRIRILDRVALYDALNRSLPNPGVKST
jgi:hypothetical protein